MAGPSEQCIWGFGRDHAVKKRGKSAVGAHSLYCSKAQWAYIVGPSGFISGPLVVMDQNQDPVGLWDRWKDPVSIWAQSIFLVSMIQ